MSSYQVVHKPEQCSFVADCDGQQALLTYRLLGGSRVDVSANKGKLPSVPHLSKHKKSSVS